MDCVFLVSFSYIAMTADAVLASKEMTLRYQYLSVILRFSLWSVYGFIAGLVATGLWVIAHECGHHAFSDYHTLNHVVGWILHSR